MWLCQDLASGRVSSSSCASMPAVGEPVTLRMLSAPAPRAVRPRSIEPVEEGLAVLGRDLADLEVGAGGHVAVAAAMARRRGRRRRRTASASGCRWGCAGGTCRRSGPARPRTGRGSASGNCPRASAPCRRRPPRCSRLWPSNGFSARFHFSCSQSLPPALTVRVLRLDVDRVRARSARPAPAAARPAGEAAGHAGGGDAGGEAFEVALLLGVEVVGHRVGLLHAARGWRFGRGAPEHEVVADGRRSGSPVRIRLLAPAPARRCRRRRPRRAAGPSPHDELAVEAGAGIATARSPRRPPASSIAPAENTGRPETLRLVDERGAAIGRLLAGEVAGQGLGLLVGGLDEAVDHAAMLGAFAEREDARVRGRHAGRRP